MAKNDKTKRHAYITWPAELHRAVRFECIERDMTLNEWIAEAARQHLRRGAPKHYQPTEPGETEGT
jgi:hypothetical protein